MDCSIMKSQEAQHLGKAKYVLKKHFESHHNYKKKGTMRITIQK